MTKKIKNDLLPFFFTDLLQVYYKKLLNLLFLGILLCSWAWLVGCTGVEDEMDIALPEIENTAPPYAFGLADDSALPALENPFLIKTTEDLAMFASVVNNEVMFTIEGGTKMAYYREASYRLEHNLDLGSGYAHTPIGMCLTDFDGDVSTDPCGDGDDRPFQGTFDGNGLTLSKLSFNATVNQLGFFGLLKAATVTDLTFKDIALTNVGSGLHQNVGSLAGVVLGEASISGIFVVGGTIAGHDRVGGIVGYFFGDATAVSSSSIMSSMVSADITGIYNVGGIAGIISSCVIRQAFATGSVQGTRSIGGLVGTAYSNGRIEDSYMTGSVLGETNVAGIAGENFTSTIRNSYVTGPIGFTGTGTAVGALVGYNNGGEITFSYWHKDGTGQSASAGSLFMDGETGTALRAGTGNLYATWDENIWGLAPNTEYPALKELRLPFTVTEQRISAGFPTP